MWTCQQCGEKIEDQFDSCWKCAGKTAAQEVKKPGRANKQPMQCLRCHAKLEYIGTKQFYEGGHFAAFFGDLFVNRESFDVYACSGCGHVEFFVDGIAEASRPE